MDKVNEEALKQLEEYRKQGCHMLVPCMTNIQDVASGFRLIVTPVQLRPHPKDKDVYPDDSTHYNATRKEWEPEVEYGKADDQGNKKKFKIVPDNEMVRISGQGLEKLAQHAAIVWDRPVVRIDRENKGRQLCELAGAVRMPDGFSFYRLADCKGMDLDIEMEKLAEKYKKDSQKWLIKRDHLQKKSNQTELVISGARNRIIRKILGIDNAYSVASLAKPFIAVRIIPWLDMGDEYTRQLVTEMNVKQMAITSLFGGQMPQQKQLAAPSDAPSVVYEAGIPADKCWDDDDDRTTVDADYEEQGKPGKTTPADPDEDVPFSLGSASGPSAESLRADFENSDAMGQMKALNALIARKGQVDFVQNWLKGFKKVPQTLEGIGAANRLKLYDHLMAQPDAGKGQVAA